jgi:SAM-dependent methyltransferase
MLDRILAGRSPGLGRGEAEVLLVGCGNSPFSHELYKAGFVRTTSIDYSAPVIASMERQYPPADNPGLAWRVMDMTAMTFADASFDLVIDKAAMDALMVAEGDVWNPDAAVVRQSRAMLRHVERVLRPGGLHLHISFAQPHFREKYLRNEHAVEGESEAEREGYGWSLETETIAGDGGDGCFHHFMYVMQKPGEPAR